MYTIIYTRQRLHSIDGNKNPAFPRYKRKRQNMKAIMYLARADQGSVKGIAYFYVGNGKGVAYFLKTHQANSNSL